MSVAKRKTYAVVTDGNQPLSRRLYHDEHGFASARLAGRPSNKTLKKKPAKVKQHILKKPAASRTPTGRCQAVRIQEDARPCLTRTGSFRVTVDMAKTRTGGNEVLHMVEMLNSENKQMKDEALMDVKKHGLKVGLFDLIAHAA